jgi:DNA-directed RNA polymerase specialized sigma24 family protein
MTVSDALASLNSDDRSLVVNAFYLAMSVAEIAHREHTSQAAVHFRLHQAMHALRTAMLDQGVEL